MRVDIRELVREIFIELLANLKPQRSVLSKPQIRVEDFSLTRLRACSKALSNAQCSRHFILQEL